MEILQKIKSERNLENDRVSFIEAVSLTTVEEIPTIFDESTVKNLVNNLDENRLFILGETHGVKENIDIIYTLFKKFGFRKLALEWMPELKKVVEQYLESGELDFSTIQDSPDGRITAGHFALLKNLKSEGLLEELICFDTVFGDGNWNTRDKTMAQNILNHISEIPTLVVAGNLHAKTEAITLKNIAGEQHPMGENLKKEIPDIASGKIEYLSGQYHNYGTKEFSTSPNKDNSGNSKFYQNEDGLYIFELPEAHIALVPNSNERV